MRSKARTTSESLPTTVEAFAAEAEPRLNPAHLYAYHLHADGHLIWWSDQRTLDVSLPESEWADRQVKTYAASRIAVCLVMYVNQVEEPLDLSILLPRFPTRAAELLGGCDAWGIPVGISPQFDATQPYVADGNAIYISLTGLLPDGVPAHLGG